MYPFFPFQGKCNFPWKLPQFQIMVEKCNSCCIFCIPFPLLLLKFFGAVAISQCMLEQLVQWATLCHFDCLSTIVHGKILYATWSVLTKENVFFQSPFSMCMHAETHPHTPPATKQPAFWRSCLRCAWSSQNLDLGDLILLLEIFRVILF